MTVSIKIDEFCIRNDGFCITNDELWINNDDLNANVKADSASSSIVTNAAGQSPRILFEGVDIVTPAGLSGRHKSCVQDLSCEITLNNSLMVTGANATGKTSFFRVLGGLWPLHKGTCRAHQKSQPQILSCKNISLTDCLHKGSLERPGPADDIPTIDDIFLVPQRSAYIVHNMSIYIYIYIYI